MKYLLLLIVYGVCASSKLKNVLETDQFRVINRIEREEPYYYTQGLVYKNSSVLLESAGLYGESAIHYLNSENFNVLKEKKLTRNYFGEGCDIINLNEKNYIYQLTWQEGKVFVWNEDLTLHKTLSLPSEIREGWGITHYFKENTPFFLITDGSNNIYEVSVNDFKVVRTIAIKDSENRSIRNLNELEMVDNMVFANIYLSDKIACIDLEEGKVKKVLDFKILVEDTRKSLKFSNYANDGGYCLNGIAWDKEKNKIAVTGKKWPFVYEIELK